MPTTNAGLISPADILLLLDALGSQVKAGYAAMGVGADSESTTISAKGKTAKTKILGDGTSSNPGLANAPAKTGVAPYLNAVASLWRWDRSFQQLSNVVRQVIAPLPQNIPTTWKMVSNTYRLIDLLLLRANASGSGTPATPGFTHTLAATTGGALASTTSGQEPRTKLTYVGASDWLESQPTAAVTFPTIAGKNNALSVGNLPGTVPTGVTKVRRYRQQYGASTNDPYGWDGDIAVTAGQAFPAITFTQPDNLLRMDINPPSWMQAPLLPENIALLILLNASFGDDANLFSLPSLGSKALCPPEICSLNNWDGFLVYNPISTVEFGRWSGGSYTEGSIAIGNDPANRVQGFWGAAGGAFRLRVLSALNTNATITAITYEFYDAANPTTQQTNGSWSGSQTLNSVLGSTLVIPSIPSDRIIRRVKTITLSGATTGVFTVEANPVRSL